MRSALPLGVVNGERTGLWFPAVVQQDEALQHTKQISPSVAFGDLESKQQTSASSSERDRINRRHRHLWSIIITRVLSKK